MSFFVGSNRSFDVRHMLTLSNIFSVDVDIVLEALHQRFKFFVTANGLHNMLIVMIADSKHLI